MGETAYTLWLLPKAALRDRLLVTINRLASEFQAPLFDPHVTIYVGPSTPMEFCGLAADIAKSEGSLHLKRRRLDHSSLYTKTCFIQFDESPALRRICQAMFAQVEEPSSYELNPHLSLIYKHMDTAARETLCARRDLAPEGLYDFDRLRVVELEVPIVDERPIREWKTLAEFNLSK